MPNTRLAHLTVPVDRVRQTVERIQAQGHITLSVTLRGIGKSICAASGRTHDIMLLIGGLADEGEDALLTVESI